MNTYHSPMDALSDLKKRGYTADFEAQPFCLYCGDLDIRLDAEDFNIDEAYRFETNSSSDDNTLVYAVSSHTGLKGTLVDTINAYAENPNAEMDKKLQDQQEKIY